MTATWSGSAGPPRGSGAGGHSGIGSWPGTDPLAAAHAVLEAFAGTAGIPHLVELPERGPGAELVGRAAALLVGLPVDRQPWGWRLVDRPGRDLARARSFASADLDALAEAADGWTGLLKVAVAGPWTLAAGVGLPRGERAVADTGSRRDLAQSLGEAVATLVGDVRRLVPGAQVLLQLDEPSLPAVLAGGLKTVSGWGRVPAVPAPEVEHAVAAVLARALAAGAVQTLVHCCARDVPVDLLRSAGAGGLSVDLALLTPSGWESVATAVEAGVRLWAGVVPTRGALPGAADLAERVHRPWRTVGLPATGLADVVLTPTCGLAGLAPPAARAVLTRTREAAAALAELASE